MAGDQDRQDANRRHPSYYATPDGPEFRNSAGRIGPLIDVRAAGGFVLAAGSVLDERAYPKNPEAAALVRGGRAYKVADDSFPAPLPTWLAALARDDPPRTSAVPARSHVAADARLQGLVATVRNGKPGDRNNPLYWASRRAAEMITAGETARETAEEALVAAALEAGLRGGEPEARRTFASAMRGAAL